MTRWELHRRLGRRKAKLRNSRRLGDHAFVFLADCVPPRAPDSSNKCSRTPREGAEKAKPHLRRGGPTGAGSVPNPLPKWLEAVGALGLQGYRHPQTAGEYSERPASHLGTDPGSTDVDCWGAGADIRQHHRTLRADAQHLARDVTDFIASCTPVAIPTTGCLAHASTRQSTDHILADKNGRSGLCRQLVVAHGEIEVTVSLRHSTEKIEGGPR